MSEEELLALAVNAPTIYVDGFGAYRKSNGILRCIGFVYGGGPQLNLVMTVIGAEEANRATRRSLDSLPSKSLTIWDAGGVTAH